MQVSLKVSENTAPIGRWVARERERALAGLVCMRADVMSSMTMAGVRATVTAGFRGTVQFIMFNCCLSGHRSSTGSPPDRDSCGASLIN